MTRISVSPIKYVEFNQHLFNKLSQPSNNHTLYQQRIALQDNLQETHVWFSRTFSQRMEKYHRFIWTISKKKWHKCISTPSLQLKTFSIILKTFSSTGICQGVPIHNFRPSPRRITSSTRQENSESLSSNGIVFLLSRKIGLHSKQNFTNPIKNSLIPDNWPSNKMATGKKILLNKS